MRFKTAFWLLLLGLVIHIGYQVIPLYVDFGRMQDTMSVKASLAQVLKDEDILTDLVKRAEELDLPLKAENFSLKRNEERRTMAISTAWDVEVHFLGGLYVRTFHFEPRVEENISKR